MNKRTNRVYWLLLIMVLIFGISICIDGIRKEKHKDDSASITVNEINNRSTIMESDENSTEIITEETTYEETTESTEVTTIDPVVANQKISEFYNGQVFMGDSIMSGFATYVSKSDSGAPQWLDNVIFLPKVSWSIKSALSDNNGPMYHGKAQNITVTLAEIKPKRIFINLGINEMNGLGSPGYSIEKLTTRYGELVEGIKNASPSSQIYIINITPCTEEKETATFSNAIIKEFNTALEEKSSEWGVTYLDLASEFGDVLDPELSSDNFVHHNDKAYTEKWVPLLEKVALNS